MKHIKMFAIFQNSFSAAPITPILTITLLRFSATLHCIGKGYFPLALRSHDQIPASHWSI